MTVLFAAACGGGSPSGPNDQNAQCGGNSSFDAGYLFSIEGSASFGGVEATWNESTRIVVLGPEDSDPSGPASTFIMTVGPVAESGAGCFIEVVDATLSTVDVQVGTAPEINGKLYALVPGSCVGGPTTSGAQLTHYSQQSMRSNEFCVLMKRVDNNAPTDAEPVKVTGEFRAKRD